MKVWSEFDTITKYQQLSQLLLVANIVRMLLFAIPLSYPYMLTFDDVTLTYNCYAKYNNNML